MDEPAPGHRALCALAFLLSPVRYLWPCPSELLAGPPECLSSATALGQFVLGCWGKWVKLIGSRRCVLSAGDLGHRFYIICSGLLTSSPPFMALPLHEVHCIQNEASCFTLPSWNPVSHLSSFGDRSSFVLSEKHARHTDGHSALHTTILCGGGGLPFSFLYKEMSRCKRGFGNEGYKYVLWCRGCLWAALSSLNTYFDVRSAA